MLEPVLEWNSLQAGCSFPAAPCSLDDGFVDAYLRATGEMHPLYRAAGTAPDTADAGYAPPFCTSLVRFTKASLGGRWPSGTLQLGQRIRSLRPLRRGERLGIDLRIGSLEERNGRLYFEAISTVRDLLGNAVGEQQMSLMWAQSADEPRAASSTTPPAKARRDPPAPQGPRIGPASDRFPMARLRAYAEIAGARDPIHLDPEFARSTPPGVNIAQGKLVMTLISRLMLDHLGVRWLGGGSLDIRFRRPVPVNEPIHAWAVASGDTGFSVWCENARGEPVIEGTAEIARGVRSPRAP